MHCPILQTKSFVQWGPSHGAALIAIAILVPIVLLAGRALRGTRGEKLGSRLFAAAILAFDLPFQVYSMLPSNWDIRESLPLQLCDLAWMAGVHALWTGSPRSSALLYYWGLTLTSQALITPHLQWDFPHLGFFMFWGSHSLVLLAAVYRTWGLGFRPGWRSFRFTAAVTALWALVMLPLTAVLGTNYGYLNAKPAGRSVLDLLGPWPWYLVLEAAAVLAVWCLLTLPGARFPRGEVKL